MASSDYLLFVEAFKKAMALNRKRYPSEWFEENPGKKPSVDLPAMGCSLDQVRSSVKYFLSKRPSNQMDPDLILLYFRKLADTMKVRLEEDWTSFGITIGKVGSEVGPLDIVDVKDRAITLKLTPTVVAGPEDDLLILMALTALYQHSAAAAENKDSVPPRVVVEQWETAGFKPSQLEKFWKNNSMTSCSSYTKMIAVFDMFLFKFPDHGLAAARNLTSVSRFQGMTAYQSLSRLSKAINKDFGEIEKWMFTAPLQKEYRSFTGSRKDLEHPHSYAPYYMALQLASLSPYSEDANPCLVLFTNMVCATTTSDPDARCARMPEQTVPSSVFINALTFSFSLSYRGERMIGVPPGNDAVGWSRWFSVNNYGSEFLLSLGMRPPIGMYERLQRTWSTFGQDRPGTIGRMLYEFKPKSLGEC